MFPCTGFNFYYIHFDTPILGGGEITRGFISSHLCFKKGFHSLDYLYSCIDLYIAMNQQKTLPKDKYECRKSIVQWDYNPADLILTMRRNFFFNKVFGKKPQINSFYSWSAVLKELYCCCFIILTISI